MSELFVSNGGYGGKVRCVVCGRTGYPDSPWQDACIVGHPFACSCGRKFASKQGLSGHLSRVSGHYPLDVRTESGAG